MHIALVHPFCWPEVRRGGERYLDDLSRHLANAGHLVDVLAGTHGQPSLDESVVGAGRLRLRRIKHRPSDLLANRGISEVESFGLLVLPYLLRRRYDVVHALTPTAALAGRLARQRTVYTLLGHPQRHHLAGRGSTFVRRAVHSATAVAALSRASADALHELFGRMPDVLSPGVRTDEFEPDMTPRTGAPRVLFSADAADRRKGLDQLLVALPRVLDARPGTRLQISSATDWEWARQEVPLGDRGRVADAVDALGAGRPEEVPARYRNATVTVLPSRGEAFGMVLVESLASGTPVVCNADGGMPEIVSDASIGRVADASDAGSLGAAILAAIALAAEPGSPGRCAAHARRWDWDDVILPCHELLYRRVARRQGVE